MSERGWALPGQPAGSFGVMGKQKAEAEGMEKLKAEVAAQQQRAGSNQLPYVKVDDPGRVIMQGQLGRAYAPNHYENQTAPQPPGEIVQELAMVEGVIGHHCSTVEAFVLRLNPILAYKPADKECATKRPDPQTQIAQVIRRLNYRLVELTATVSAADNA